MTWRGKTGTFWETYRSKIGVSFEWKIPDIFSMQVSKCDYYTSPSLKFFDSVWYLSIYPRGKSFTSKWISVEIMRTNPENSACVSVGVKTADGSQEEVSRQNVFTERQKSFVFTEFLLASDLVVRKHQLAPADTLTATCTLWREAPPCTPGPRMRAVCGISLPTQTWSHVCEKWVEYESYVLEQERAAIDMKSMSALREQFKDLLSSGEDHDVTIKVGDREFNAHKCILRARSTVFGAMFKHGMKESTDSSITIEDYDPDAFGEFLRYMYTGKVEDLSLSNAMELYYAADKYDIPCLKETCLHFLKASLSVTAVCDVIILATKHGEDELLEQATSFFMENTKEILATAEWRAYVKTNPDEANELYMKSFENVQVQGIQ